LKAADLGDVRNVEMPRPKSSLATNALVYRQVQMPAPPQLLLKGISSARNRPLALINDQTLAVGESAKVRVGTTNVLVRCLAIGPRSVRIQVADSGRETELFLAEEVIR
jgi:sRNA-binding protein